MFVMVFEDEMVHAIRSSSRLDIEREPEPHRPLRQITAEDSSDQEAPVISVDLELVAEFDKSRLDGPRIAFANQLGASAAEPLPQGWEARGIKETNVWRIFAEGTAHDDVVV